MWALAHAMTDPLILDRVRKLIALSSSSFVEEARTAAMQAAKLIREHKIDVGGIGSDGVDRSVELQLQVEIQRTVIVRLRQSVGTLTEENTILRAQVEQLEQFQPTFDSVFVRASGRRDQPYASPTTARRGASSDAHSEGQPFASASQDPDAYPREAEERPAESRGQPSDGEQPSNGGGAHRKKKRAPHPNIPRATRATYDCLCMFCGTPIRIGEMVLCQENRGITHARCRPYWLRR